MCLIAQSLYTIERGGDKEQATSYPDYLDLRDRNRSFEGLTAYIIVPAGLDTGKNPSESWGYEVTGNYFDALGIQPYLGRFFHAADEHGPNSAPYLVMSYDYWHSHFQDDRTVVGRVVRVNKHPFTDPRRGAARSSTGRCCSSFPTSGRRWSSRSRYRDLRYWTRAENTTYSWCWGM